MRTPILLSRILVPLTLMLPALAGAANSVTKALGVFNVFVGLMLTAALLIYGVGFVVWLVRLGTWPTYRTEGIKIMEWAVVVLFVLVVLLAIVQFLQYHPRQAGIVGSFIVAILIVWMIVYLATHSGGGKKKDEGGGPEH